MCKGYEENNPPYQIILTIYIDLIILKLRSYDCRVFSSSFFLIQFNGD